MKEENLGINTCDQCKQSTSGYCDKHLINNMKSYYETLNKEQKLISTPFSFWQNASIGIGCPDIWYLYSGNKYQKLEWSFEKGYYLELPQ